MMLCGQGKCNRLILFLISSASILASQSLDSSLLSQRNPTSSTQTSSSDSPVTATQNTTPSTNSTSNTNTTTSTTSTTSSSSSSCSQGIGTMPSSKPNSLPPFGGLQSSQPSGGQSAGTLGDGTSATSQPQVQSEPAERYHHLSHPNNLVTNSLRCDFWSVISLCLSTMEREKVGVPTDGDSHAVTYPPAIVIYIVNPFSYEETGQGGNSSMWTMSLLRCYLEMLQSLPPHIRNAVYVQVRIHLIHVFWLWRQVAWSKHPVFSLPDYTLPVLTAAGLEWGAPYIRTAPEVSGFLSLHPVQTASGNLH